MTPNVTRTAQVLADNALGFLALLATLIVAAVLALLFATRRVSRSSPDLMIFRRSLRARGSRHLVLGFVAIAAVAAFSLIASQVSGRSTIVAFDQAFAKALHETITPGRTRVFRAITTFGIGWVLGIASGLVGLWLLARRHVVLAVGWGVAQVGAVTLVRAVKAVVLRTRPDLFETHLVESGWSFPSGHVARTVAFCAMSVYLISRLSRSWSATAIALAVAVVWSLLMAFSRLYLGVHFVSDVVGALVVGTAWVAVCISAVEEVLHRRGKPSATVASGAGSGPQGRTEPVV